MDKIIVVGGGGHAKVLISILRKGSWDICGYSEKQDRGTILDVPYLGNDDILKTVILKNRSCKAIVGVGKIDTSPIRLSLQHRIKILGFEIPPVVSPNAVINREVEIGEGTLVCDGAVVNSGTIIGKACIINSNSTIEHDCRLGEDVHIAPGVTLSGEICIGHHCMIGAGAVVIQNITICENCLVGAGSTVINDIGIPGIYAGNPTKRIR
jgi:sugar O-acyltransferase (sialic acid O-acetyltransferase NeuD family)